KCFWTAKMPSHGRTIWYKALTDKIPLQRLLSKYHPPQSPLCVLCHQPEDTIHFLYSCPFKKHIWTQVLREHSVDASHHHYDLAIFLLYLRPHTIIKHLPQLLTVCGYVISEIWTQHWLWKIHGSPFDSAAITSTILTQLATHYQPSLE
ncbi:hypothetical protein BC941DRAFT_364092, partial [Chlamydoabsidia padenii]